MTREEKIEVIAEILEVEENEVIEEKTLSEYDTWDSVAVLSMIALMNDEFDRYPSADEILSYKKVSDLMNAMQ